ncbi:hypothetical protein EYZ11_004466 [Aspergillus tanneri]|uniref:N-acetylgalactosaminide beta-1,3-galactosyltransferase n=1 Tax=Aspergillus tanneri TaxID=1220188 RepID=A0A4S3JKX8_9EURO|nr:uncharacterized protein ATNIH1004_008237 [Aspergillus tanneri]KAA8644040.1 hypothetical protein ATNIH1004_008237 [Aspergillus tanneri]THC96045.1 hypothetical protein EYZ11_004466 [Aspergillus tanneri]
MKIGRQCASRRWRVFLLIPLILLVLWLTLPYDHPLRLAVRFNLNAAAATLPTHFKDSWWLSGQPAFPIALPNDVAVVMKSGYGTKDRIAAWLEAHEGKALDNLLIVGDFSTPPAKPYSYHGQKIPVHDLVARMLETGSLPSGLVHSRLFKYSNMTTAISSGDTATARSLSKSFGWELDALKVGSMPLLMSSNYLVLEMGMLTQKKFISGLELCYQKMPDKSWYILADDDTYLLQPSLQRLLEHLDPSVSYYLGNAVGDYKGRFAHGGSSVILSRSAIRDLFANPTVVSAAHLEALEETWGDKLVATTLIKIGIYLDERYTIFFNGEQPQATKITPERFCAPIASFHGLASSSDMLSVGKTFHNTSELVLWIDLWDIYGAPSFDSPVLEVGHKNWDYVGRLDEATISINDIISAQSCSKICRDRSEFCLAWTWDSTEQACHLSPWITLGDKASGKSSGINIPRAKGLASACRL